MCKLLIFYCFLYFTLNHCSNQILNDYNTIAGKSYKRVTAYTFNIDAYVATQGGSEYRGSVEGLKPLFQGNYTKEKTFNRINSLFVNQDFINAENPFVVSFFDSRIRYFEVDVTGIKNQNSFASANSFPLSASGNINVDRTKYRLYLSNFFLDGSIIRMGQADHFSVDAVSPASRIWIRRSNNNTAVEIARQLGRSLSLHDANSDESCTGNITGDYIMSSDVSSSNVNFASCEIDILHEALTNLASKFPSAVGTIEYLYENINLNPSGSDIFNNNLSVLYSAEDPNQSYSLE